MNTKIFLSIAVILLCFSCKFKTKQEVSINPEQETDMAIEIPENETQQADLVYFEIPQNSSFQGVISNFYKYKDENRLFEGLDTNINYYFTLADSDTLLIFNFEKGTVKEINGRWDKKRDERWNHIENYIEDFPPYFFNCIKNYIKGFPTDYVNYIKGFPTERTISGDFNGDRKIDTLMLDNQHLMLENQYDKLVKELMLLVSSRATKEAPRYKELREKTYKLSELSLQEGEFEFVFSDKTIPGLKVVSNFEYTIKNEGDLDGDGGDEIGFLYGWGTSACRSYTVYTLKNNKWYRLIEDIESTYDMREMGIVPVEKDPEQEGVILIRSSEVLCCIVSAFVVEKPIKIKDLKKYMKKN
jgi:hypothetical protein